MRPSVTRPFVPFFLSTSVFFVGTMALRAAITSVRSDARDEGFFGGYTPSRPSTSADGRYLDGDWRGTAPKMASGEGRNHDRLAVASAVGEEERRCWLLRRYAVICGPRWRCWGLQWASVRCWVGRRRKVRHVYLILGWFVFCLRPWAADVEVQFFCMPCDEMIICALVRYGPAIYILIFVCAYFAISYYRRIFLSHDITQYLRI